MSVNTYKSTDKSQLSEHFNVSEFKCKCSGTHDTKLDSTLISMLEKLRSALNSSKIIVNSGYRCRAHDKAVGGSGSGQHTLGTACDIVCYDSNNNAISSKIVSCVAQDLGFGGIANIGKYYTSIHLDVRSGVKWFGDETKGYNNVTSNFYSYYNLSKSDIYGESAPVQTSRQWTYKYDPQIAELQRILNAKGSNLTVDGKAGEKTYNALQKYTIQRNDKGSLTKWVQLRLNTLGFNCGSVDGIAGSKTMSAIAKFQAYNSLNVGNLKWIDWYWVIK